MMKAIGVVGLVVGFFMFAFAFGEDTTEAISWWQGLVGLEGLGLIVLSAHWLSRLHQRKNLEERPL